MVLLNEGLAFASEGRWSFLCPSLWGDMDVSAGKQPLAMSVDGDTTWIIGSDDLYLADQGVLTKQNRTDLSSASVVALSGNGIDLYGLRIGAMGTEVVRIEATPSPPVWSSSDYYSALTATADGFYLARVVNEGEVGFLVLDAQAQTRSEFTIAVDRMPARILLRPTEGGLHAVLFDGNLHYELGSLAGEQWQLLQEADGIIAGPEASPGGLLWVSIGGKLQQLTEAGFEPNAETRYVTCLGQWGGKPYACLGSEMYWLTDGGLGERFFELRDFSGPDPALVPAEAEQQCGYQWLLFRGDLSNSGLEPQDWTVPPADAGADGSVRSADATAEPDSQPAGADARAPTPQPGAAGESEPSGCSCALVGARSAERPAHFGLLVLLWGLLRASRARRLRQRR